MSDERPNRSDDADEQPEDPRDRFRRLTGDTGPQKAPEYTKGDSEPRERPDTPVEGNPLENTGVMEGGYPRPPQPKETDPRRPLDSTGVMQGGEPRAPQPDSREVHIDPTSDTQPTGSIGPDYGTLDVDDHDVAATQAPEEWEQKAGELPSGLTPPPPLGANTFNKPRTDTSGMPLPGNVPEIDMDATQVSDAAFTPQPRVQPTAGRRRIAQPGTRPRGTRPARRQGNGRNWGCLIRIALALLFILVLVLGGVATWGVFKYRQMVRDLPDVAGLRERASQFETTRILDAEGHVLYQILDPTAGRRTYTPLEDISPYMVAAIVATEDGEFYSHPGVNIFAIIRAFYQNTQGGEVISGASTITQQLARALLLSPEDAATQSYDRKLREALLAIEITRRYSKDEILELYLNEVYFGNLAYGVEAAAEVYFNANAASLDLTQASFLAGLPQSPSVYDVYTNPEVTFARQRDVLRLMYETSEDQGCIFVSNSDERVCVPLEEAAVAAYALEDYEFPAPVINIVFPHWVNYIRTLLEEQFDPQTIYRSGFTVHTTLVPELQQQALASVQKHVFALQDRNVQSGALVAIDPHTGHILAMVGSADYYNEDIDGQINMAVAPRQPGSSIKPFTYVAAFEKGWTPGTLIWDVESEFPPSGDPNDPREPYVPVNYDERFHGPVLLRTALANSYNVPAVKTLDFVGIYNEGGLIPMLQRLGISTLTEDYYGLSLTLGGGEVTLLEMTAAYAVFANNGQRVQPVAITRITDFEGNVVYEYQPAAPQQLVSPQHAYLITDILSDNAARTPAFGPNSILNTAFPAAAKTGTTNDFRDNWTLGYTPDVVVGVWVGNPDFTEMINTSGLTGAAPIWAEFTRIINDYLTGGSPNSFPRPDGIVEYTICNVSGAEPSEHCEGGTRREIFAADQPPKNEDEDLWQDVLIDTWTRLKASPACNEYVDTKFAIDVDDEWGREWILETSAGRNWVESIGFDFDELFFVPQRECTDQDPQAEVRFVNLDDGDVITSFDLDIIVVADGDNYYDLVLDYAPGVGPRERDYITLAHIDHTVPDPDEIYEWDLRDIEAGKVTLRIRLWNRDLGYAEEVITLDLNLPTPTPQPTDVPTDTPTVTPTFTSTPMPSVTPTPTTVPPSATATPNQTGTAGAAMTLTAMPSPTPTTPPP